MCRYSFNTYISSTVSTHTFQVQFQHTHFKCNFNTHFKYSFHTHISSTVSTHTFQVQFQHTHFKCRHTHPPPYKNSNPQNKTKPTGNADEINDLFNLLQSAY